VLNPEGLRFPDEFVRHKALDAIGDVSLLGMPIVGKLVLHRSGHQLNAELVKAVLADAKNYEIVVPSRGEASERQVMSVLEAVESVA
jgi:UDP-3-O-[3-hydroxymyristoyl] N-acetylglucosamine deacetylase